MNPNILLLLGSNQGDRAANLRIARDYIESAVGVIVNRSGVYRSAAWGMEEQPDFYNQVVEICSPLSAEDLLHSVLDIEYRMGRVRRGRWGPRLIDIDILLYGDAIINTKELMVPHPGIASRRFTLVPLAEIAPQFIHPVLGKSMIQLLEECEDPLRVEAL